MTLLTVVRSCLGAALILYKMCELLNLVKNANNVHYSFGKRINFINA